MRKKLTRNDYIKKARQIHKQKYDYSETHYGGANEKITIICPKHGAFQMHANQHLQGYGCPQCAKEKKKKQLIANLKKLYKNQYDYSRVNYINSTEKIEIICPKHGSFWLAPQQHLRGYGCPECRREKKEKDFIREAKIKYGDTFDYSKTYYTTSDIKVCIIGPDGEEFWQQPRSHLSGAVKKKLHRKEILNEESKHDRRAL